MKLLSDWHQVSNHWLTHVGPNPLLGTHKKKKKKSVFFCPYTSYIFIQICQFNLSRKLEYCIKHLRIKHHFHSMCSREQNRHFMVNFRKILIIKMKVAATREVCGSFSLHNKWPVPMTKCNNTLCRQYLKWLHWSAALERATHDLKSEAKTFWSPSGGWLQ